MQSTEILNQLYEYDDFMQSIATLVDLGCGTGQDLEWWATRTTRDDDPEPLNIQCVGVDLAENLAIARKYHNVVYQRVDFEQEIFKPSAGFDVLWCYNAFQYAVDPIGTLSRWWNLASTGGMLAVTVPQTVLVQKRKLAYYQQSHCFFHHTMISLIHMLAVSGWDCRSGFFLQRPNDLWIQAIVYKSNHEPMNPKITTWYELSEKQLLPESADVSIRAHGFLRQQDLVVPWIDKSVAVLSQL